MSQPEEAKVVYLRERLSAGAYRIDPGSVADAILRRPLGWYLFGLQRVLVTGERCRTIGECHPWSC